ncbi:RAM signaling pathway protein-domain-containing protein [Phanerochaete sordida]|uniref:RAM signaling pathway protein-domain-containing protein n=1 Tax=Phanerochaete sordida TaxID=48140 RepID=A0A9P3LH43_9APHY|nr:RAM signaling pathway protein-domain-containing protein [Phanerochaete sordida]
MPPSDVESSHGRAHAARNGAPSPLPSVSLSRGLITDALRKSADNGATLDLAHKNLTDVGEDGAAELANVGQEDEDRPHNTVIRIALSHNRLTTLPMAFALLSGLRYLNLKCNNFTVFPDVLTIMPSLEILDVSRNKIKRFPSQPGSLAKLRVFSVSRNKIHRIPSYFVQFRDLTTFKAEQNPLEWPPKDVMEAPHSDQGEEMKEWIQSVQTWIDTNTNVGERSLMEEPSNAELDSESVLDTILDYAREESLDDQSLDVGSESPDGPGHQRKASQDSDVSVYSEDTLPQAGPSLSPRSPRPPRLHLEALPSSSRTAPKSASPARSPESYLPTPDESEEDSTQSTARQQSQNAAGSSYSPGAFGPRREALTQKSLPELRPVRHGTPRESPNSRVDRYGIPSPPHRQESDSSNGSLVNSRFPRVITQNGVVSSPVSLHQTVPPMDAERNSYFRRMSSLTPTALLKTVPADLLALIDAIRGILFSVCQIYQALQHYTVYAIDERLSTVLLKVLQPATACMNQLIQALDRFDTVSRRTLPSTAVCRAVVESCRENVVVFSKAVGVLSLQLKVIATSDDARYTRQMLLILYGATAEISHAWRSIASRIETVKPFLKHHRPSPVRTTHSAGGSLPSSTFPPWTPSHVQSESSPASRPPFMRSHTADAFEGRVRVNRRHAGSFSHKDLQIGKMLPSFIEEPLPPTNGSASPLVHPPALRPGRRPSAVSLGGTDGTVRPSTSASMRWDSHSRQSSASSFAPASMSSPSLGPHKPAALDVTSSTIDKIDKEAIDAVRAAVDAAPVVWDQTEGLMEEDPAMHSELHGKLLKAKDVTQRLRASLTLLEKADVSTDRSAIREDAHLFVNIVISLLSAIKVYGQTRSLPADLRQSTVTLSNATQAFVMLLHVSSFSPAPTPRPYSPMVGVAAPQPAMPPIVEDDKLGASITRSRSAVPSVSSKLAAPFREPPRSALAQQTFAI